VLAALHGVAPARIEILLAQRDGAPRDILNAQLGPAAQYVTAQSTKANRVTVDVRFDASAACARRAVVLLLDDDVAPFRLLSWRDETGEPLIGEASQCQHTMILRPKPGTIRSLSSTAGHVIATVSGFVVFMSIAGAR